MLVQKVHIFRLSFAAERNGDGLSSNPGHCFIDTFQFDLVIGLPGVHQPGLPSPVGNRYDASGSLNCRANSSIYRACRPGALPGICQVRKVIEKVFVILEWVWRGLRLDRSRVATWSSRRRPKGHVPVVSISMAHTFGTKISSGRLRGMFRPFLFQVLSGMFSF